LGHKALSAEAALFYSDGLVEAHNLKREIFGFPRLQAFVAEHAEERSSGDFLLEELDYFVGGLGAGRRIHSPHATMLCYTKLSIRDIVQAPDLGVALRRSCQHTRGHPLCRTQEKSISTVGGQQ